MEEKEEKEEGRLDRSGLRRIEMEKIFTFLRLFYDFQRFGIDYKNTR